jgi:hypothetical protein
MHTKNETVTLAWCDPGNTDALFTDGIMNSVMSASKIGINFVQKIRVQGNQIGRQRQVVFDEWANNNKSDWLLWIDSDIVITIESLKILWDAADKFTSPVISGVYFISPNPESSIMTPSPAIFYEDKDTLEINSIHPLPENKLIEIDSAGFGFLLMHKSIIEKILKVDPGYSIFGEREFLKENYVSEDIVFFRKLKKAGIPAFAHTGALVKHMKRFAFDIHYYNLYWTMAELNEQGKLR